MYNQQKYDEYYEEDFDEEQYFDESDADAYSPAPVYAYEFDDAYVSPNTYFEITFPGPLVITAITILLSLFLGLFLIEFAGGAVTQNAPLAPAAVSDNPLPVAAEDSAGAFQPSAAAAAAPCEVNDLFPKKVRRWCNLISYYAGQKSLNPDLVAAVIWLESGGNEVAYSKSGAVGLMQVMPQDGLAASFMCVNGPCFGDRPTTAELQNPEFNIKYGTRMLAQLLNKHGDIREALKSYGPMNVGYYYADKVLGLFNQYGKAP